MSEERLNVSILGQADDIVNGPRQADYGHPRDNLNRIAQRWAQVLGVSVTAEQVALCMIDLKVARLCNGINHRDSWLDIAGYVGVWEKISEPS